MGLLARPKVKAAAARRRIGSRQTISVGTVTAPLENTAENGPEGTDVEGVLHLDSSRDRVIDAEESVADEESQDPALGEPQGGSLQETKKVGAGKGELGGGMAGKREGRAVVMTTEGLIRREEYERRVAEDDEEYESDDDDGDINRIGNIPIRWYDEMKHIGYTIDGEKLAKTLDTSEITKLLKQADDPDAWRTISDVKNQTPLRLSATDLEIIRRIQRGSFPDPSFDPYGPDSTVDFENAEERIHPSFAGHDPKRRFVPSSWESKKMNHLVKLIREGKIKLRPPTTPSVYDVWGSSITVEDSEKRRGRPRGPPPLPAPKVAPPGHAESYNPAEEYLLDQDELEEWHDQDPEDRLYNFIPKKFHSLRHVPLYANGLLERFERCLDLYLCPRSLVMRMNVDPSSILPPLPSPKDLRPFPSFLSMTFDSSESKSAVIGINFDPSGLFVAITRSSGCLEIFDSLLTRRMLFWKCDSLEGTVGTVAFNPSLPILAFSKGELLFLCVIRLPHLTFDEGRMNGKMARTSNEVGQSDAESFDAPSWCNVAAALKALHRNAENDRSDDSELNEGWEEVPLEIIEAFGGLFAAGWCIRHKSHITHISWHAKGLYLSAVCPKASSPSQQVAIHSLTKLKTVRPFRKGTLGRVQRVMFHPKKPWLFVAYLKGLRLFDLQAPAGPRSATAIKKDRVGGLIKKFVGCDELVDMSVHPSGDHVLVGGANRRVTWFDLDLGVKPYKILRYHKSAVKCVGYHSRYPLMFSGSLDGTAHIFHAKVFDDLMTAPTVIPLKKLVPTNEVAPNADGLVTQTTASVSACCWHPIKPWVLVGTQGGTLGLYV